MTAFSKKLSDAVKSVFNDMRALSNEELREEVNGYLANKRTLAIHYAWDYKVLLSRVPSDPQFNWDIMQPELSKNRSTYRSIPSLFTREPIERHNGEYSYVRIIVSDDYFMFRAAA